MQIIWDILLQTGEILTLVIGILGLASSLMLVFSPAILKNIGKMMNRQINIDDNLAILDKDIATGHLVFNHPTIAGICLIAGSVFALVFFFFKLDISNFSMIFLGTRTTSATGELFFSSLAWISRIACLLGLVYGILLLIVPQKLRALDTRLNAWVETRGALDKLNRDDHSLDSVLYRYPVWFGVAGAIISFVLIVLSILNILD